MTQPIPITEYQRRVHELPEEPDLFLGGSRGGSKTYCLTLLALRHVERYGDRARVLCVRRSYKGLADWESQFRELFGMVYGGTAIRLKAAEHTLRAPNGGYVEFGQLECEADYGKYQGRSFNLILVDEAQQFPDLRLLDMLRSNLRAAPDIVKRFCIAANPGGIAHQQLARRYALRQPWTIFREETSQRDFINCPATFTSNQFLDAEEYRRQLVAACGNDKALLGAWETGDWTIARGSFFGDVFEESRCVLDSWGAIPKYRGLAWPNWIGVDFGIARPTVAILGVRVPVGIEICGRWFPRDSIIAFDEYATDLEGQPTRGNGATILELAQGIRRMCERWDVRDVQGVGDDAMFARAAGAISNASVAEEFAKYGVRLRSARKGSRQAGWTILRERFAACGSLDRPGLFLSRNCRLGLETLPSVPRDPRDFTDLDSRAADDFGDALRYLVLGAESKQVQFVKLSGTPG